MSHVTIIRPPIIVSKWCYMSAICPPIGPAYLAASLQAAGHTVRLIDALGEGIHDYAPTDIRPGLLSRGLSLSALISRIPTDTRLIGV